MDTVSIAPGLMSATSSRYMLAAQPRNWYADPDTVWGILARSDMVESFGEAVISCLPTHLSFTPETLQHMEEQPRFAANGRRS